jgi:hypothetical protein
VLVGVGVDDSVTVNVAVLLGVGVGDRVIVDVDDNDIVYDGVGVLVGVIVAVGVHV